MEKPKRIESYDKGEIYVALDDLPLIKLRTVRFRSNKTTSQRLRIAMRKREFTLVDDWEMDLGEVRDNPEINGTITITRVVDGNEVIFDGASVPLARTISWLTQGILSPLGVMFIASVVHDFIYKFGYLEVREFGADKSTNKKVPVERHQADRLFRDMIWTVNKTRTVGAVAWLAVRLGWPVVRFTGKRRGGDVPFFALSFALGLLTVLAMFLFDGIQPVWANFGWFFAGLLFFPPLLWLVIHIFAAFPAKNSEE
ncbi:MAG: DUF1353 domain-containing protein [Pseudomonadota bacterium]